jgi:hypothetical protein
VAVTSYFQATAQVRQNIPKYTVNKQRGSPVTFAKYSCMIHPAQLINNNNTNPPALSLILAAELPSREESTPKRHFLILCDQLHGPIVTPLQALSPNSFIKDSWNRNISVPIGPCEEHACANRATRDARMMRENWIE